MRTYTLEGSSGTFKIQAQNKDDLKKKAYGKVPDGHYSMYAQNGSYIGGVNISKRSMEAAVKKRPKMSKEDYDQLYFYVGGGPVKSGESPLRFASPRRYDDIDSARKGALAKSKKIFSENMAMMEWGFKPKNYEVAVYKGTKYMGSVYYDRNSKAWVGLWYSVQTPKDPSPLRADGSIGAKKTK